MEKRTAIILGVAGISIILLAIVLGGEEEELRPLLYEVTYSHGERAALIGFDFDITVRNVDNEGGKFTLSAYVLTDDGRRFDNVFGAPVPYPGATPSLDDFQEGPVDVHIGAGEEQTVYLTFVVPQEPVEVVHVYYNIDSSTETSDEPPLYWIGKICGILLGIGLLFVSAVYLLAPESAEGYLEEYERRKWEKRERAKIGNLTCLYCGKVCKSGGGRSAHERACSENPKNKPSETELSGSDRL